ncbi:hypothetical protein JAAARDRAFT_200959 [Jaapia argillacea MUCL 33604]|uniref:Uncharacterized protein n=1 Tax=Jaapia argillacea MUCL 33604 TaxID=933084 RepID=A0A067PFT0_9AGAM|nr:hypothetical protein JAAARDRAFT_200959 [Jaapia argillacea MUCL 33604]
MGPDRRSLKPYVLKIVQGYSSSPSSPNNYRKIRPPPRPPQPISPDNAIDESAIITPRCPIRSRPDAMKEDQRRGKSSLDVVDRLRSTPLEFRVDGFSSLVYASPSPSHYLSTTLTYPPDQVSPLSPTTTTPNIPSPNPTSSSRIHSKQPSSLPSNLLHSPLALGPLSIPTANTTSLHPKRSTDLRVYLRLLGNARTGLPLSQDVRLHHPRGDGFPPSRPKASTLV